jgi:hypothetical protein
MILTITKQALAVGLLLLCAACAPSGPVNTPERIQCLRVCDKEKSTCTVEAQSTSELSQCEGKGLVCAARCPR